MIEKIELPNKREFRMIKNRLPPHKFTESISKSEKGLFSNNSAVL